MKKTRRIFIRALTALAFAAFGTGAWAAPAECGMVGTWSGMDTSGGTVDVGWLGVHTAGTTSQRGAMILDWIWVSPSLLGPDVRLTPGRGVWEQVGKGRYNYAWYAYGVATDGTPVAMIRVSGTAANNGCDKIDISYTFQIFAPLVSDPPEQQKLFPHQFPADANPYDSTTGYAVQYRVPLLTVTPPGP